MPTCCKTRYDRRVKLYHDDRAEMIALDRLLASQPLGTHLYICGPAGMIDWARDRAAALAGRPKPCISSISRRPSPALPFDVTLARQRQDDCGSASSRACSRRSRRPASIRPICAAAASAASARPMSISPDGKFIHNDHWLSEEEHRSGRKIMPCVSRFEGRSLVLER